MESLGRVESGKASSAEVLSMTRVSAAGVLSILGSYDSRCVGFGADKYEWCLQLV